MTTMNGVRGWLVALAILGCGGAEETAAEPVAEGRAEPIVEAEETPAAEGDCGAIVEGLNEVASNRASASQCFLDALAACDRRGELSHQTTSDEGAPVTTRYRVVMATDSCQVDVEHDASADPNAGPEAITRERCNRATMEMTSGGAAILVADDCN